MVKVRVAWTGVEVKLTTTLTTGRPWPDLHQTIAVAAVAALTAPSPRPPVTLMDGSDEWTTINYIRCGLLVNGEKVSSDSSPVILLLISPTEYDASKIYTDYVK